MPEGGHANPGEDVRRALLEKARRIAVVGLFSKPYRDSHRVARYLQERGYDVVRWNELNLYFGGASAVAVEGKGKLEAAGDPRRGGAGVVVE